MQREILYIANQEIDILPNTINRNLQINDFGSAEDRQSNYSNTVKLPMTSNNRKVFDFLGVSGNTSRKQYQKLPCRYVVDGIPLITNGYAEVKASSDYYEVVLYDGVVDLAERLKGKKLNDLNYSDINHYLNRQTYEDSLDNTTGYIYALGDFGFNNTVIKAERQMPSVYVHTLWDKIFTEAGVDYFGDFFTINEDFLTEVVTPPIGYDPVDVNQTVTALGAYQTTTISRNESSQDIIFYEDVFDFSTTFPDPTIIFGSDGNILVNEDISLKIDFAIDYRVTQSNVNFRVYKNDSPIEFITLPDEGSGTLNYTLNISLLAGDVLRFSLVGAESINNYPTDPNGTYTVDYSSDAYITFSEVSGGFLIDFQSIIGEMDCIAFIKDVMQRHGLVLKPIKNTSNYEFIRFEQLLTNRNNAEDWSDKFSQVNKEDYRSNYAQINKAKYKYPEEIQNPIYDGELTISDENADGEKTFFSSPYEIAITEEDKLGEPLYKHAVWKQEDGETKVEDAPIKLFRIKRVNNTLDYQYFNDSTTYSYTGELPYLSYEKVDMQYFLNVNYKAYKQVLDNFKEVEATVLLKELDIYNVDFFKLKYLKQTGKFYYCSKIKHKTGTEQSKVILIEINEFLENLPVQQLGDYTKTVSHEATGTVPLSNVTTLTTPPYSDPESDEAYAVKFISGYNNQLKLFQDGVEIIDDTEILTSNWNVTYQDMGITNDAHAQAFDFQIKDAGSQTYGSAIGTLNFSVNAYQNTAPIADAGADRVVEIDTSAASYTSPVPLDGSGSSDSDGISSYSWLMTSSPASNTVSLLNANTVNPTMEIPNDTQNIGVYVFELTVTDSLGLSSTDSVEVTVNEGTGGIQPI